MWLCLNHLYPPPLPPPPKTLLQPSSRPLFPIPKTLLLHSNLPLARFSNSHFRCSVNHSNSDIQKLPHSAIQRIAEKLRSLGLSEEKGDNLPPESGAKAAGEIFVPLPHQIPKNRVGHTLDPSWSTPENPVPRPGSGYAIARYYELRDEIEREREKAASKKKERVPTLAELTLSTAELRRLRTIGIAEQRKLKVGKAGVTEGIVNGIHERWRREEVVKIVCEDFCRTNMKRAHDLLERKTGGVVVWRSGAKLVLYRGANYKYPYFKLDDNSTKEATLGNATCSSVDLGETDGVDSSATSPSSKMAHPTLIQGVGSPNIARFQLPGEAQLAEEADHLLDGLGPRFTEWWGYDPLPVDADLLPAIVPGYRRPFRLLPYGISPTLTNDEMTTLKRLGQPLPCHFALGRNRKLQGLAAAIVKLWEKCEIAKIAIKRGVQNTNGRLMAEELKWLTGGTLLSRDREYFVLYRGKDFLPLAVSSSIEERRKQGLYGDKQRMDGRSSAESSQDIKDGNVLRDFGDKLDDNNDESSDLSKQRKLKSMQAAIKRTSIKLSLALEKKAKAEKVLEELESTEMPQEKEVDKEGITEEERYMLRKIGLKMKPFLLTGRRGVFAGTIENMHLHWKYRELVKIICKEKGLESAYQVARTLEAESGGILVAVEHVTKGYAIIVYRGKNYRRPPCLRPVTLLSKRAAMKRSIEAQRRKSLKLDVLRLTRNIDDLKLKLAKENEALNMQSVDDSRFQVDEDMNLADSDAQVKYDSETRSDHHSDSVVPANGVEVQASQCDLSSIVNGDETGNTEPECESTLTHVETNNSQFTARPADVVFIPDEVTAQVRGSPCLSDAQHGYSDKDAIQPTINSPENLLKESVLHIPEEKNRMPSRVQLSNKDRLLLRKQALKMKKRPVLAGRIIS
ncbi:hypothetical protein K2173_020045 [Erythroxylum novogranatense]|uniref:CRM domain-containing protein n=1 Tax=Erythroxylum novogranatense TaxID=1862640 RepID=A0AAV8U6X4_9ROSI|nr:hypothetical protein K2173_020045 [Erythroxylum novogranatense]